MSKWEDDGIYVYHSCSAHIMLRVTPDHFEELSDWLQDYILRVFRRTNRKGIWVAREVYGYDEDWDEAFWDLIDCIGHEDGIYFPYGDPTVRRLA